VSERPREPVEVLVVDDHDVVHWGFRVLLDRQSWVGRCDAAVDAEGALASVRRAPPDVALIDLFLGGGSGAELCREIREISPDTSVLLVSGAGSISAAVARAAGASGFVSKDLGARDVINAVRIVSLGIEVFGSDEGDRPRLSPREEEVIALIAAGATNAEIAERMFLSPHTVKDHTSSIYRKLGVRNRAEAVKQAQRLGLIT
jgi:DNA-binding NarL/FixJ family response regulator